ncbi:Ricin-type beta-trefoil lectin domain-containing protein [Lentzea californiensis]|nr:Ricin-type beta-trefoil lectin domain-containing protein [Lentzea californiensis]
MLNHTTRFLACDTGDVVEPFHLPVVDTHWDGSSAETSYRFNDVTFAHRNDAVPRRLLPQAQPARARPAVPGSGRCVEVPGSSQTNGAQVALRDCTGGANQTFDTTSSRQVQVYGTKCLNAAGSGTTPGTAVTIWDCNGSAGQQWNAGADGTIRGAQSGLCLDATGAGTANGTLIVLWTCTGASKQRWTTTGGPNPTTTTTTPPAGTTPVARHGQLRVCGTTMCDKNGARVQLRGVSSFWLNWENPAYAENLSALQWMRDNWNLQVIRAAMGVEPSGAYLSNPAKARAQVETIINNAVTAGVYVIVDWHAHEAQNSRSQAVAFFSDLARRYGHLPNVIWEPWNEPLQVSWTSVIKPYHQAVVSAIRASDPDNIIVLGTSSWSRTSTRPPPARCRAPTSCTRCTSTPARTPPACEPKPTPRSAPASLCSSPNGAQATQTVSTPMSGPARAGWDRAPQPLGASVVIGRTRTGDGRTCLPEAQSWIDWMRTNGISWTAWKLHTGTDSTNLLRAGAPVSGGWNNHLHGHAPFVVAGMR